MDSNLETAASRLLETGGDGNGSGLRHPEQPAPTRSGSEGEHELLLLIEASGALLASPESQEVLDRIISLAQKFVAADAHAVWRKRDDDSWRLLSASGLSPEYLELSSASTLSPGHSLPTAPVMFENVYSHDFLAARHHAHAQEGIRSMLVVPLSIHGEISGTVVYYWRTQHQLSPGHMRIAAALGNMAAAALGTAELYERQTRSRERAEWSERRSSFLAKAGATLASSLDLETTLANLAKLAVPDFADWCSIDIVDDEGHVQRVAIHHADPARIAFAQQFARRYPPREDDATRVALRTGKSLLVEKVTPEMIDRNPRGPEHAAMVRELGLSSVILAPMLVGDKSLGIITFVCSESGRHYTHHDLAVAEELSRRAGIAISHARHYRAARENEERLRLVLEAANLGVWELDLDSGRMTCSDQCKRNFGADVPAQLTYESLCERIYEEDRGPWREACRRAADEGSTLEVEYRVWWPDGTLHWVLAYGRCLHASNERPSRMTGVTLDITERRTLLSREQEARRIAERLNTALEKSNRELRRANEDLNQFAYSASHDLQEPLRMVAVYSQLLERRYGPKLDGNAHEYLRFTIQGARRMEALLKDLLAYSQAGDASGGDVGFVDAGEVLDQVLLNLRTSIEESSARISRDLLPPVRIKGVHLLQLLQNLVGNAIKYRRPDTAPLIHVSCSETNGYCRFAVADNGIGIPAPYHATVFGIFKRLHSGDTYDGTGIGLAICQRIVEHYGGKIWVESEEGAGATFCFTLPLANSPVF